AEAYLSATLLNRTTNYDWDGRPSDYRVDMFLNYMDYDFLSTMDIEVVQGRNFSREYVTDSENAYILNEEAIRQMNIQSPIGKRFSANGNNGTIVGVVKDVHIKSLHEKIHPLVCMVLDDYTSVAAYGAAIIRLNGERTSEALGTIERVWNEVNPVSPFEYSFLGQTYNTLYAGEQKLGTIINTFTFIAVLISILGLFGLSSYIIEQRTKEVGIRKVLGSSVSGLLIHLNKDFIKWVLLANIFAWPAGYFIMEKFLEQYAYRTAFGVGTYLFSGLLALIIAVVTVSFQSAKSANANPVDSLRY
ncbi:MAG: ABC transporter permease, partial [bacterium]|nr:ABC transporter permease [bacterium]